jgi:hypothetical protein
MSPGPDQLMMAASSDSLEYYFVLSPSKCSFLERIISSVVGPVSFSGLSGLLSIVPVFCSFLSILYFVIFRTLLFTKDSPNSGPESPGGKIERTSSISNTIFFFIKLNVLIIFLYTNTGKFANSLILLFRDPKLHLHFSLRITSLYTSE